MHFVASFRAIIFSLDRLCNERLFAPFVRLLSFNSVVKQKSAAAVEKRPFKIPSIYNNDHKDQQPYNTDFTFSKLQIIQVMKIVLHNSKNFISESSIKFMISKAFTSAVIRSLQPFSV